VAAQHLDQRGQTVVVEDALPGLALVEILHIDHALQVGIVAGGRAKRVGDEFAQAAVRRVVADAVPAIILGDVEADDRLATTFERVLMVGGQHRPCCLLPAVLPHQPGKLIVEYIGQAFVENQRQDEILELGRIRRPPDFAGGVPQPLLQFSDGEVYGSVGFIHHGR